MQIKIPLVPVTITIGKPPEPPTFIVRFRNSKAVSRFEKAKKLIAELLENAPWYDELREASECLEKAWDGLTFRQVRS